MNVFSEKSALFNSETQRWLKFIIHFLQNPAKPVPFAALWL